VKHPRLAEITPLRAPFKARIRIFVLAALGLCAGYPPLSSMAWAQDDRADGPVLSIGLNERLEWSSNPSLAADSAGGRLVSNTRLTFSLSDSTALSRFELTGNTGLRIVDSAASGFNATVADPRIALAYSRLGATSQLDINAGLRINDIAFLRPLTDFIGPDGVLDLPTDFDDLRGSGTRQSLQFGVKLSLREDAPFGLVLAAGVTDLRYIDVTNPDLTDNTRGYLRATARLDITEVTQATIGLGYRTFIDGNDTNGTLGL
jgi:hypothetical protein